MQQWLGVAARLLFAFEHQVEGSLVCRGFGKAAGHFLVQLVTRVLLVHHGGHALECGFHFGRCHHAVVQPVGDVLARNTQSSSVFHQAHVVDVWHFRAAHALVHPAHHVAQDALHVVVQLLLLLSRLPVGLGGHGHLQQVVQEAVAYLVVVNLFQLFLHVGHFDLVVVHGVQHSSRWAWHPCGVGACFGVTNFLLQHLGHQVGHGPHAFADLRFAAQAA